MSLHKAARNDLTSMISKTRVGPAVPLEQNNTGLAEDIGDQGDVTARGLAAEGIHHTIHQPKLADDFADFDNRAAPPFDLNKKQSQVAPVRQSHNAPLAAATPVGVDPQLTDRQLGSNEPNMEEDKINAQLENELQSAG